MDMHCNLGLEKEVPALHVPFGVIKRGIPEHIPAIRLRESMPGTPNPGRDAEFGNQVPPEGDPLAAFLPNRQFRDCRHSIQDREPGEAFLLSLTVPTQRQGIRLLSGLETGLGVVSGQVHGRWLGSPGEEHDTKGWHQQFDRHVRVPQFRRRKRRQPRCHQGTAGGDGKTPTPLIELSSQPMYQSANVTGFPTRPAPGQSRRYPPGCRPRRTPAGRRGSPAIAAGTSFWQMGIAPFMIAGFQ